MRSSLLRVLLVSVAAAGLVATCIVSSYMWRHYTRAAAGPSKAVSQSARAHIRHAPDGTSVILTNEDGIRFSLRLPPGWDWDDGALFVYRQGSWNVATMRFDSEGADSADSAEAVAERILSSLEAESVIDARDKTSVARVQERRIIEVSGSPAVWDVVTIAPKRSEVPHIIETRCFVRFGRYDVRIWSNLTDLRSRRSSDEVAARIAECLAIVESLRIEVPGKVHSSSVGRDDASPSVNQDRGRRLAE
jgi:hypothetical protein